MIKLAQRWKWWLFAIIALGGLVTFIERWRGYRENSQDKVILAAGARYGVDPALIKAVVWRESWFNPRARGGSGEIGLMQIRTAAAKDWVTAEKIPLFTQLVLYDPARNTECGTWYLKRLLARYQDSDHALPYALAAYNAGPSHVARWRKGAAATNSTEFLQQMDFPSTRKYVRTVSARYEYYRKVFPPRPKAAAQ
jgi:soluble lytic murein transglycosylase